MNELSRLIADIKAGKCALILGPEIFYAEDQPLHAFIKNRLLEKYPDQIAAYYERDGFFLLRNPDDKPEMQDEVQYLYRTIQPDRHLLIKLIEIPFSLILSVNPDTWLRDLSFEYGLPNRFAWFNARKQEEFLMPDVGDANSAALRERIPQYYNLCGCIDDPATLVLDYDDLFRLLEGMLGAPKLPEKMLARLKDTTSYLFLGFQFDRWHTQLLLRLLDVKNAARRFALQSPVPADEGTEAFLLNQFRIKFLGNEEKLIDKIHETFEIEGFLRPLAKLINPRRLTITDNLQKGNLAEAISRLLEVSRGTAAENHALLLSARYNNWQSEKNKGTHDSRDLFLQYNQITDGVLNLVNEL